MATQKTASELFVELSNKTINKFASLDNSAKLELLNEVLIVVADETAIHARSVIEGKASLTFTGSVAPLPSDFNYSPSNDWGMYTSSSYDPSYLEGGKGVSYDIDGTDIRFNTGGIVGGSYFLKYLKEPNQYTDMGDTVEETKSPRLKSIIKNELESLLEFRKYQGQLSASAQASRFKADELK